MSSNKQIFKKILLSNILVFFFTNCVAAISWGIQILLGNVLSKAEFGDAYTLLSFFPFVFGISSVITFVILNSVIENKSNPKMKGEILSFWVTLLSLLTIFYGLLGWLVSPYLYKFFNFKDSIGIFLLVFFIGVHNLTLLFSAYMQGEGHYVLLSIKDFIVSIIKFPIIFYMVLFLGLGYFSPVLGEVIIGIASAIVVGLLAIRIGKLDLKFSLKKPNGYFIGSELKKAFPPTITTILVGLFFTIDITLVKIYFPPDIVGEYSSASALGRIGFYLPGGLAQLLYVQVLRKTKDNSSALPELLVVLAISGSIGLALTFVAYFFSDDLIRYSLGSKYISETSKSILWIATVNMTLLSMLSMILNFLLAKNIKVKISYVFLILIATTIATYFIDKSSPIYIPLMLLLGLILSLSFIGIKLCKSYFNAISNSR